MEKINNLENSNSNNTSFLVKNMDDDEIMENILEKINKKKYDFINDIIGDIINKSFYNFNDIKLTKMERAEIKLINKIYDKFNIKKNIGEPIDLVYTFINYNDKIYNKSKLDFKLKNIDEVLLKNFKEEKKEYFNDFILNLKITKKNIPFIRKIYVVTPTPDIIEDLEDIILIPIEDIYGKDNFRKIYFRPNQIIKYLTEVSGLSNLFFYGTQDMLCIKKLNKELLIKDGIPIIPVIKKNIQIDTVTRNIEEYNTNKLFEEKFEIMMKICNVGQLTLVRKDVIQFTKKLFMENYNIDFLLLQYFVGYFFYLYELDKLDKNYSGFYSNTQKNMYERFNIIKNKRNDFFCINYLSEKHKPYYLHTILSNMGLMREKVKKIFFLFEGDRFKYFIPTVERILRPYEINFEIVKIDKIYDTNYNFGECLYLVYNFPVKKLVYLKHLIIEIFDFNCIGDLLFLTNNDCKGYYPTFKTEIHYPERVMKRLDERYKMGLLNYLGMELSGEVKTCNIEFMTKSE